MGNMAGWGGMGVTVPPKKLKVGPAGAGMAAAPDGSLVEVRYGTQQEAATAMALNGTQIAGRVISVEMDTASKDGTKVLVHNAAGIGTLELKTHFQQCGNVLFAGPRGFGKGGGGKGGGLPPSAFGATSAVGELRFDSPQDAQNAVGMLNGSMMGTETISAMLDTTSRDGTKVIITGLPVDIQWQDLKDQCKQVGSVAYCNVRHMGGSGEVPGETPYQAPAHASHEGEVRYDAVEHTQLAMTQLNGSVLGGAQIWVRLDANSKDGTRLIVSGIPSHVQWQELKDHFATIGQVAFAEIRKGKGKGKGGGDDAGFGALAAAAFEAFASKGMKGAKGAWANPAMAMNFASKAAAGKGFGGGGGGGKQMGSGTGEIRYDNPAHAQQALALLNGSQLQGATIMVAPHGASQDGSKLTVTGIPPSCQWQELKDHFAMVGQVAFAKILSPGE